MKIDENLVLKILEATQSEAEWKTVLDYLIEISGSIAASITLRDQTNCQVIVDDAFEHEFHSPFVARMDTKVVSDYVLNLREKDAWAEVQIVHRPIEPLLMSNLVSTEELLNSDFGRWAAAQGFNDTVVYQIGRSRRYWTALNLFFHNSGHGEERAVFDVVNTYSDVLKGAWSVGRDIVRQHEVEVGIFDLVSDLGRACCLVSSDGRLKARNQKFESLVAMDLLRVIGTNRRMSIAKHVQIAEDRSAIFAKFPSHYSENDDIPLSISSKIYPVDPLYKGKKDDEVILFFEVGTIKNLNPPSTSRIDLLCPQEKSLYEHVLDGRTIEEAGKLIGLKRARTYEIWRLVKEKTGVRSAHSIRG